MSNKNFTNIVFMILLFFVLTAVCIYGIFYDIPLYMELP